MIAIVVSIVVIILFGVPIVIGKILKKRRLEIEREQKLLETIMEIERMKRKLEEEDESEIS